MQSRCSDSAFSYALSYAIGLVEPNGLSTNLALYVLRVTLVSYLLTSFLYIYLRLARAGWLTLM